MKWAAAAFAFGLALPVEAQTLPPAQAQVEVGSTQDIAPLVVGLAPEMLRDFHHEKHMTFVALPKPRSCASVDPSEIVVCARSDGERYRMRTPLPPALTLMEDITQSLTINLNPKTKIQPYQGKRMVGISFLKKF